ncbi:MAG: MATE family efflux transporter [Anaerolineaceae bacterium]|nr:MATE family efflux transporter [Anaerolineaceae bacterium]
MLKIFSSPNFKPFSKSMFRIALPIAFSGIIMQLQMLIDTAFLARYTTSLPNGTVITGSEILSAVGNVFFPYIVTISLIWSIGTGVVILVSQHLGAGKPQGAQEYGTTALKFNTLLSWFVYLFWLVFAEKVFTILGVKEPILSVSLVYIRFVSIELLYLGLSTTINAVFQGVGNTRPEMFAGIIRSVLHVVLDYILIFGHFGFQEMGVAGAGIASSISGLISTLIMLAILLKSKSLPFKMNIKAIFLAPIRPYLKVLKLGLPSGLEEMIWNSGNLVLAYFLNIISLEAVGIYRLVYQIEITPIFFYLGLARAVTTLVGQRTGERDISSARESGLIGTFYAISFCLLFTFSFALFPRQIISIFTPDTHLIEKAAPFLVITAFTMIPRAINIISGNAIRGYGDTMWMLVTQIFGIVFIVTTAYILMFPLGFGMYGLFIAMFADETLRGIINTTRFYRGETSIFHKVAVIGDTAIETA